tara:strand:- start:224 stop:517 length:294 start_codon:yes stop_codon:yes gene_type:complete
MEVNNKLIQHIAQLSKLKFDLKSSEKMKVDLEKILSFIDKLNEVETKDIEPLIYMSDETNVLRCDDFSKNTSQEEALSNAPQKDSDYFIVPRVIKNK